MTKIKRSKRALLIVLFLCSFIGLSAGFIANEIIGKVVGVVSLVMFAFIYIVGRK